MLSEEKTVVEVSTEKEKKKSKEERKRNKGRTANFKEGKSSQI